MLTSMYDKAYLINAKQYTYRLKHSLDQCKKNGIEFELFHAITPSDKEASEYRANVTYPTRNLKGDIGCALSHLALMKLCIKNNYKSILVMEDDITFSKTFLKESDQFISEVLKSKIKYDILYFHRLKGTVCNVKPSVLMSPYSFYKVSQVMTHFQIYTQEICRYIVNDLGYNLKNNFQYIDYYLASSPISCYAPRQTLVIQDPLMFSTISKQPYNLHNYPFEYGDNKVWR
jgi:GR25 family glycosyltransferase involved in LPS biosynthesis